MDLFTQSYMGESFVLPTVAWGDIGIQKDVEYLQFDSPQLQANLEKLVQLKDLAAQKGIKLVAAITPLNPAYAQTDVYGYWGPRRSVATQIFNYIQEAGIIVFDENKDGKHDYTDDMAFDSSHLSYKGAAQFSKRLDSFLETLK